MDETGLGMRGAGQARGRAIRPPHRTEIAERLRECGLPVVTIAHCLGESVGVVSRWFELIDSFEAEPEGLPQ